ncbi:bifunctional tetrahydrofolate synthase/dihydrofolate synthase, partial [Colwellia sp. BRX8-8]|nr:bifunctional tetrahydrofolate synthase/dihydrofolate synthase [Colwellia sp. BRX8-8]
MAKRLNIDFSFAQVITVAGTNGKGTTCAFIENALLGDDKTVAVYSSPHIEKFNERLRINNIDVDSQSLINAFEQIEQQRG